MAGKTPKSLSRKPQNVRKPGEGGREGTESTRIGESPLKTEAAPEVYSETPEPLEKTAVEHPNPRHIEAMRRYRRAGYSYEKIAYYTGWSPATVHRHTKDLVVKEEIKDEPAKTANSPGLTSTENVPTASITSNVPVTDGQNAQPQKPAQQALVMPVSREDVPDGYPVTAEQMFKVPIDPEFLLDLVAQAKWHKCKNAKDFWDRKLMPALIYTTTMARYIPHKENDYEDLLVKTIGVVEDATEYRERVGRWKQDALKKGDAGPNA